MVTSILWRVTCALLVASATAASAAASEIVVKNDQLPPTGNRFVPSSVGQRYAVKLTAPVDGNIVGVQLFWGSPAGGTAPSQQAAIHISAANGPSITSQTLPGTIPPLMVPTPGTVLATINSPVLIDGGTNEFRYTDPATNLLPLNVPVTAGEDFFVDLEAETIYLGQGSFPGLYFDKPPFPNTNANINLTIDRNLFHSPDHADPVWFQTLLPIAGSSNWGIRAIIQPVPEPSTYALAAVGIVALLAIKRRKSVA